MRQAAKVDANQAATVKMLRQIGASVQVLSAVGKGCPDLLVGWRGHNTLLEIKDGDKVPSKRVLTADEKGWHGSWNGQVAIAETPEDAVKIVIRNAGMPA
jgi:hypothetical protein